MQQIYDSHVHLFTNADLQMVADLLPYVIPKPHPLKPYLDALLVAGKCPRLINNVHLSILPDSENVFRSFAELAELQQSSDLYDNITLVGTMKADPAYATQERLAHPQVKGVRIVLHDKAPEAMHANEYSTGTWQSMYAQMRHDQHVHIYAKHPQTNLKVLRQIPENITVAIDHLGICYPHMEVDHADYQLLLSEASRRGNVFFKGPGYRTHIQPENVAPFVVAIIEAVGADKLVLEASDAPHVGGDDHGQVYADHYTPEKAFAFTHNLAMNVAGRLNVSAEKILHKNLYLLLKL